MSILLALLLYAAVAAPGILSLYTKTGWLAGLFYVGLAAGLTVHHIGLSVGAARLSMPQGGGAGGDVPSGACGEAIRASEEAGLVLDRRADRVVVNGPLWQQLPQQVRDVLAACLSEGRSGGDEVEIVERAGS